MGNDVAKAPNVYILESDMVLSFTSVVGIGKYEGVEIRKGDDGLTEYVSYDYSDISDAKENAEKYIQYLCDYKNFTLAGNWPPLQAPDDTIILPALTNKSADYGKRLTLTVTYHANKNTINIFILKTNHDYDDEGEETSTVMANNGIEFYSKEALETLNKHIEKYFGKVDDMAKDSNPKGVIANLLLIKPTIKHNYYTSISIGLGALKTKIDTKLPSQLYERIELILTLPADWEVYNQEVRWNWPLNIQRQMAQQIVSNNTWTGSGHVGYNLNGFYYDGAKYTGALFINPPGFDEEAHVCRLSDGETVKFYQILFLYDNEASFRMLNGVKALQNHFPQDDVGLVLDINRKNHICEKEWYIKPNEINSIFLETIPLLEKILPKVDTQQTKCFISHRILVDGCKVGYMEHNEPTAENVAIGDSGWAFFSNDEDEAFLKDSKNYDIYSLNTIAVFAPDIIPYLASPYGSAFYRGDDGKFYPDED